MTPKKSLAEMLGDAPREIAVLVIVFAPLDRWVEHKAYTWGDTGRTFAISATLFIFGAILEKVR
jgi:hypothetical protein